MKFIIFCLLFLNIFVADAYSQFCELKFADAWGKEISSSNFTFLKGDTISLGFKVSSDCSGCAIACTNCSDLNYTIRENRFQCQPFASEPQEKRLRFTLSSCSKLGQEIEILAKIKIVTPSSLFSVDFGPQTNGALKSSLVDFFNSGSSLVQIPIMEGDSVDFKISIRKPGQSRLTIDPSLPVFEGMTYADDESIIVSWAPTYRDFKKSGIRDFRFSCVVTGAKRTKLSTKIVKFKIVPRYNLAPLIDRTKSDRITLSTDRYTSVNMAEYFLSPYDRMDDRMSFDYFPKSISAVKINGNKLSELVIDRSAFLSLASKPKEIKILARHQNSAFSDTLRLVINSHFDGPDISLENRKFSFFDDERIDEMIKIEVNDSYKLSQKQIEILGDTATYNLKRLLLFDDENPEYLRMYSIKKVEIKDSETDDLTYTVNLKFINEMGKASVQVLTITIHPRVNGDVARKYFKQRVDSLEHFLDSLKSVKSTISLKAERKGKRIDGYVRVISFIAIVWGSYGTAKNSANYGYSIAAGMGLGALFVDLKQIDFFVTKGYLRAKTAAEALEKLESDIEKHLSYDMDKMGVSFFEANYIEADRREERKFSARYKDILTRYCQK